MLNPEQLFPLNGKNWTPILNKYFSKYLKFETRNQNSLYVQLQNESSLEYAVYVGTAHALAGKYLSAGHQSVMNDLYALRKLGLIFFRNPSKSNRDWPIFLSKSPVRAGNLSCYRVAGVASVEILQPVYYWPRSTGEGICYSTDGGATATWFDFPKESHSDILEYHRRVFPIPYTPPVLASVDEFFASQAKQPMPSCLAKPKAPPFFPSFWLLMQKTAPSFGLRETHNFCNNIDIDGSPLLKKGIGKRLIMEELRREGLPFGSLTHDTLLLAYARYLLDEAAIRQGTSSALGDDAYEPMEDLMAGEPTVIPPVDEEEATIPGGNNEPVGFEFPEFDL